MRTAVVAGLILFVAGAAGRLAAAEPGLVAEYRFDDGPGTVLHDRSANANHGTVHGAGWASDPDETGHDVLRFDGVDDYVDCGIGEAVRRLTGKRGVDVVVEHTGEATWATSVRCLTKGGRLVTCGATSGAAAAIDLRVLFFKQLSLLGSTMGSPIDLRDAFRLVRQGRIRPVIDRSFAMEELPEAHR